MHCLGLINNLDNEAPEAECGNQLISTMTGCQKMKKNVCIKLSYVLQLIIIVFISNFIAACSDKKQSKCSEQVNGHIEYKLNNGSKEIMRTESQIEDIGDNDKEKKDLLLYLLEIQKANLEDTIQEMRSCNS